MFGVASVTRQYGDWKLYFQFSLLSCFLPSFFPFSFLFLFFLTLIFINYLTCVYVSEVWLVVDLKLSGQNRGIIK